MRKGRTAVALAPMQDEDRIVDHDAVGYVHECTAGKKRVVQHGERVGRRTGCGAEKLADVVTVARRDIADPYALRFEPGIDLVVDDAAVTHDQQRGVGAGLSGPRPPT